MAPTTPKKETKKRAKWIEIYTRTSFAVNKWRGNLIGIRTIAGDKDNDFKCNDYLNIRTGWKT